MTAALPLYAAARLRLLSLALAPPSEETMADVAALASALSAGADGDAVGSLASAAQTIPAHEAALSHERLFGGDVAVAPYEGSYEVDPFRQARQMADIAGFYSAFGASTHGPRADRPDHAGAELEFLSYLALRRLEAEEVGRDADADRCAEIEASFLAEHAGRWLPVFFAALERKAADSFHQAVGRLGSATIRGELERRGIEVMPVTPPRGGARPAVEADELTCGADALASQAR